jgi:hypothetical protein
MPNALDKLAARGRGTGTDNRAEDLAEAIVADCGGDPFAAVLALVRINHALMLELQNLVAMTPRSDFGPRRQ